MRSTKWLLRKSCLCLWKHPNVKDAAYIDECWQIHVCENPNYWTAWFTSVRGRPRKVLGRGSSFPRSPLIIKNSMEIVEILLIFIYYLTYFIFYIHIVGWSSAGKNWLSWWWGLIWSTQCICNLANKTARLNRTLVQKTFIMPLQHITSRQNHMAFVRETIWQHKTGTVKKCWLLQSS